MVGQRIKQLRKERGWSQPVLARLLGVDFTTLSNYESERRQLSPQLLAFLAKTFDVSSDYLLGLTDERKPGIVIQYTNLEPEWAQVVQSLINKGFTADMIQTLVREAQEFAQKWNKAGH